MYETIIAAVGAILANIFPAIIYDRKETVRNLDIRLTKLEHDLDAELRKSGTGYSELHMNQAMQLLFETLKHLDVSIRIKPLQNNCLVLDIANLLTRPELESTLKITAQDVLDFETSKTVFEMIGAAPPKESRYIPADSTPETKSVLQIMQKSRKRYNQRLTESHLSGGKS